MAVPIDLIAYQVESESEEACRETEICRWNVSKTGDHSNVGV